MPCFARVPFFVEFDAFVAGDVVLEICLSVVLVSSLLIFFHSTSPALWVPSDLKSLAPIEILEFSINFDSATG